MADRLGTQVGNYRLIRLLGQGGFADVYLGEHIHLGTQAAVKLLPALLASDGEIEKFRQEARTIATLSHPHIVRVLDFGIDEGLPYLVLEYAAGGSLRQRHPSGSLVPLSTVVSYVQQIAQALQHAHDQKIIHRDIKPQNLLIGRRGEILLSDFGISVVAESTSRQQEQGFAGTLTYSAPEQLEYFPRPASDQYALAVVVYEWLCGKLPFTGALREMIAKHLFVAPPPLRDQFPDLPPTVEQVVLRALAKDPKARFATVRAFAAALEEASLSRVPAPAVSTGEESYTPSSSSDRAADLSTRAAPIVLPLPSQPGEQPLTVSSSLVPTFSPGSPSSTLPNADSSTMSVKGAGKRSRRLLVICLVAVLVGGALAGLALAGRSLLGNGTATRTPTATATISAIARPVGSIREFSAPTSGSGLREIVAGPDGNLWFAESLGNKIGRMTPAGEFKEFPLPKPGSVPLDITVGPDGNLWFTEFEGNRIGRITTAGDIKEYSLPTPNSAPDRITTGPDGNLWFTEQDRNQVGRMNPTSGETKEFPLLTPESAPRSIISGPDGNLWFTEFSGNRIGRITPTGDLKEFPLPTPNSHPAGLATGADGNLWFTEFGSNRIGLMTPSGNLKAEFLLPTPNSSPQEMTAGADGNLWFGEYAGNRIGRITPTGDLKEYTLPTLNSQPEGISAGPDKNLWFTEYDSNQIALITSGK